MADSTSHRPAGLPADLSLLKPSVVQQLAAAAPVALVAAPGVKPETGLVLSVAPLMGAAAAVDAKHPRWLHVQASSKPQQGSSTQLPCLGLCWCWWAMCKVQD